MSACPVRRRGGQKQQQLAVAAATGNSIAGKQTRPGHRQVEARAGPAAATTVAAAARSMSSERTEAESTSSMSITAYVTELEYDHVYGGWHFWFDGVMRAMDIMIGDKTRSGVRS